MQQPLESCALYQNFPSSDAGAAVVGVESEVSISSGARALCADDARAETKEREPRSQSLPRAHKSAR